MQQGGFSRHVSQNPSIMETNNEPRLQQQKHYTQKEFVAKVFHVIV